MAMLAGSLALPGAAQSQLYRHYGQAFTAPAAPNTFLQQLTVGSTGLTGFVAPPAQFTAGIHEIGGGNMVGSSLFSQVLGSSFGGFTLTPDILLRPGATYAVFVELLPGSGLGFDYEHTDADGRAIRCGAAVGCISLAFPGSSLDLSGFAVRFGPAPTVVPEPSTLALVGTGLLAVGGAARRRTRRAAGGSGPARSERPR
jgi:hypothetical protein